MDFFKTSYILTKYEILFLYSCISDTVPSPPAQYILSRYLTDSLAPQEAVEGLVYKKLAKKLSGRIVLEPVVDLLMRSALHSDTLWIAECGGIENFVLLLRSDDIYIHIRRYQHISDAWKITPYQSRNALLGEFDGLNIAKVIRIGSGSSRKVFKAENSMSWIEDGRE